MFGFFNSKPRGTSTATSPAVLRADPSRSHLQTVHPFKKKFDYELNSWCYGLENLGETPLPQVVFRVVREFRPVFAESIATGFFFDIDQVAKRLFEASQKAVPLKEIAMALVAVLPEPEKLPVEQQRTFSLVLAQVELTHAGAVNRVKQRIQPINLATPVKAQSTDSARPAQAAPPLLSGRV